MGGSKNGCNGTKKSAIEQFFMEQKVYDNSQGGTTQETIELFYQMQQERHNS
jgi:hypothetical protein